MSTDRIQRELADALHGEVDAVPVDHARALAAFPRRLSRRRNQRRGASLALAAVAALLVGAVATGTGDRRAEDLPVDEPDRVVTIEPRGTDAFALGSAPSRISLRGTTVWAATATGSIARVETTTGVVTTLGSLPSTPFDVEPTDRWLWVSMPNENKIVALDPSDGHIVHTVTTPKPGPRALTLAAGSLWATAGTELLRLDPGTGQQLLAVPLPGAGLPYDVAVSADSVWVTDTRASSLTRYRIDSGQREQIDIGGPSGGIVVADSTVWVALVQANNLVRLDAITGQVQSRPTVAAPALGLAVIAGEVWAGLPDADQVVSFDARSGKAMRSWRVGDFPPIVTGDEVAVYVSSNLSNQIIRVPLAENGSEP